MEYSKNTEYGKTICHRCLISPDREEAAIFIGMNKVISRALDADGVSTYPCKILNRFKTEDEKTKLQALALINDVNKYRIDLATN
jgi:uncharacterized protein with von Willebrand factor type A (vWA) domain